MGTVKMGGVVRGTRTKELEQFLPDVWKQENATESAAPVDA
jgi:hypothetical protein